MYGQSKRKSRTEQLGTQIVVANIASGRMVTFNDDGASPVSGQSNHQRSSAFQKLKAIDEDGDPLFVLVEPLAPFVKKTDGFAAEPLGRFSRLHTPSSHPDFATLQDKYNENERLREAFQDRVQAQRTQRAQPGAGAPEREAPAPNASAIVAAEKKQISDAAIGASKPAAKKAQAQKRPGGSA